MRPENSVTMRPGRTTCGAYQRQTRADIIAKVKALMAELGLTASDIVSVITQFDGPMITFGDGLRRHQERD